MNCVFTTLYGSHLFGCAVASSDEDYKSIHLESLKDLLGHNGDTHAVNTLDSSGVCKVEQESFSLRFYLAMLAKGQVIAMDMFFSPKQFWRESVNQAFWGELQLLKPHILTSNLKPFGSYAKNQAFKYGNKGLKLLTVQKTIRLLEANEPFEKLVIELVGMEGIKFTTEHAAGGDIRHISICGKSFGETTAYSLWLPPLRVLEQHYGERARLSTGGLDLKAQYHTVRICSEALEFLSTGHITFPRPEAMTLLKIRSGAFTEEALRELVDTKMHELESCVVTSSLRPEPDWDVINDFIYSIEKDFLAGETR